MSIKGSSNQCLSIFEGVFANPIFIERFLLSMYSIIFLVGIIGNIMTIVIIKCNSYLRTPTNFYLLNLAVSDLMMLMCNLPLEMIEIYYRHWPVSLIFCQLRSVSAEFFTCSSILTILAFTCERYFAIVRSVHFQPLSHFRRAQTVIIVIWFISLLFSLPLGLSYEIRPTTIFVSFHSNLSINNSLNQSENKGNDFLGNFAPKSTALCNACLPKETAAKRLSVIVILTSLCLFYLPMIIIGTIYLLIGRALRRANKYDHYLNGEELSSMSLSSFRISAKNDSKPTQSAPVAAQSHESIDIRRVYVHVGSYGWLKSRARCRTRQVVVKMLIAVVVAFFVCYAPLYLQRLLVAISNLTSIFSVDSPEFLKATAYLYVISGLTFYFGSVINPILYNIVSNKYRRAFRKLVCCRKILKHRFIEKHSENLQYPHRLNPSPVHYFTMKKSQMKKKSIELQPTKLKEKCQLNQQKIPSINVKHSKSNAGRFLRSSSSLPTSRQQVNYRQHVTVPNGTFPNPFSYRNSPTDFSFGQKRFPSSASQSKQNHFS